VTRQAAGVLCTSENTQAHHAALTEHYAVCYLRVHLPTRVC